MTDADRHWSDPEPETVAPGVHRIPLPLPMDGLKAVNVYVLETGDGVTCIDAGWAVEASRKQLEEGLRSLGHRLGDVTRFLVTHAHRDHYTQAVTVRRELGRATIELGIGEKPSLDLLLKREAADPDPLVTRLVRAGAHDTAAGWRTAFDESAPRLETWAWPDAWVVDQQVVEVGERRLRAVATPGHTAGHVVFVDEPAGVLFAGDHVLPTVTPSVGFELVPGRDPLGDFMGSLRTVRDRLPDLRLLPAHGAVTESSHRRADELLAHHDHRLELCLAAVDPDGCSAYDVARRLTWTRHERALAELDLFNTALASMETMWHLDLLVFRGQLGRADVEGTMVYRPVLTRIDAP